MSDTIVLACRGCCCGTAKHPDTDHQRHVEQLVASGLDVEITPCLGPCRWSNVYVVADRNDPAPERQIWLGKILTGDAIDRVIGVAGGRAAGHPSDVRVPPLADRLRAEQLIRFRRPRRRRSSTAWTLPERSAQD